MRSLLIGLAALVVMTCTPLAEEDVGMSPVPSVLSVSEQVVDNLDLLYWRFGGDGGAHGEYILCLQGESRGDTLHVADFRMPHMISSTAVSAAAKPGSCDQYPNVLGSIHNHPKARGETNDQICYLSRTDLATFAYRTDFEFTFLQCGRRDWAWWHRSQVGEGKLLKVILPAVDSQRVQFPKVSPPEPAAAGPGRFPK